MARRGLSGRRETGDLADQSAPLDLHLEVLSRWTGTTEGDSQDFLQWVRQPERKWLHVAQEHGLRATLDSPRVGGGSRFNAALAYLLWGNKGEIPVGEMASTEGKVRRV